jgi:hypothetical protein
VSEAESKIRSLIPFIAESNTFAVLVSAANIRADRACWEYTDGRLPVFMGQLTMLMNSSRYSALLALNAHDIYFELRNKTDDLRARAGKNELNEEQMVMAMDDLQFLTRWLSDIEIMAQEAAEFSNGESE